LGSEPDPHRHVPLVRQLGDLGDFLPPPDVPRVQPDAVRPRFDRFQRQRVVEVDVGDHRDRRLGDDRPQRLGVLLARHRAAHHVGARVGDLADLIHRRGQVRGLGLGHRLHGDRRAAADRHPSHEYLPFRSHV
jgi:hypothetical protein